MGTNPGGGKVKLVLKFHANYSIHIQLRFIENSRHLHVLLLSSLIGQEYVIAVGILISICDLSLYFVLLCWCLIPVAGGTMLGLFFSFTQMEILFIHFSC